MAGDEPASGEKPGASATVVRVLIADDDPIARRFLESAVSRAGYEDRHRRHVAQGAQDLPGLVTPGHRGHLDWMMPGLTGVELCEKVRAATPQVPLYLIVLTSRGETSDVVRALQAGADDHITKPFEPAELRARLAAGARIVTLQQQLADRVRALEEALAHVQQLQGLIPICAWCRQIRSDGDFWEQVDSYLTKRSGLQFTHAICPTCRDKQVKQFRASVSGK